MTTWLAIGELVDQVNKVDPGRLWPDKTFAYIDIASVDQAAKAIVEPQQVAGSEAPSRARQLVRTGDVLVSTVRPNLNAVAEVPQALDGAIASTGFAVLRPRAAQLHPRYLYHWVRSREFVAAMVGRATGASYPAVSDRIVKSSELPLPPMEEQRRIAAMLDQADELRAKRQVARSLDYVLGAAVLVDVVGDPYTNPHEWPIVPLASVVDDGDRINYGVVQPGPEVEGGVPLVRVSDLVGGNVRHDCLKRIAPEVEVKYRRSRIRGNEVLVSCVGSIGLIALASERETGFNIARAVARVPLNSEVSRAYVAAYLASPFAQGYFVRELRTVAQPTLNIKQITELPLLLPSAPVQQMFEKRMAILEAHRLRSACSSELLDEIFFSLQHRAIAGQL